MGKGRNTSACEMLQPLRPLESFCSIGFNSSRFHGLYSLLFLLLYRLSFRRVFLYGISHVVRTEGMLALSTQRTVKYQLQATKATCYDVRKFRPMNHEAHVHCGVIDMLNMLDFCQHRIDYRKF
jgi:hypothetical protein